MKLTNSFSLKADITRLKKLKTKGLRIKKAFTLIELLVVIAIIGILAGVVTVNVGSAQAKARDAKRISDMKAIQTALEMYYDDNQEYPTTADAWKSGTTVCNATYGAGNSYTGGTGYIPNLAPKYISVLPENPKPSYNKCYTYKSNGTDYKLLIWNVIENYDSTNPNVDPGFGSDSVCTTKRSNTYAVYSSGGRCW